MSVQSFRDHGFLGFDEAVVIDVETTGLNFQKDRIVALGMIHADFREVSSGGGILYKKTFEAMINPGVRIPKAASKIHGIYKRHVKDKPSFAEIAQYVRGFIRDWPLIGHNVTFDKLFLSAEFRGVNIEELVDHRSYCTMGRMREFCGYNGRGWYNSTLDDTARKMGIEGRSSLYHSPLEDAKIALNLAYIFFKMDNGLNFS